MHAARIEHTATVLASGKVLAAGGLDEAFSTIGSAETYDPSPATWTATGAMNIARSTHAAALLENGNVLVSGGSDENDNVLASAELYNPSNQTWTVSGPMNVPRANHTFALFPDGAVLVAGGNGQDGSIVSSAEEYLPPGGPTLGGSYAVVATIVEPNYQGSSTNTFVINSTLTPAAVTLSNLTQIYDGTARSVAVSTVPSGLAVSVTYDGSTNPPSPLGSYTVVAAVTSPGYQGSATGTLIIENPPVATVVLGNLTQDYDGTGKSVSVSTMPPGLSVSVTYNGSSTPPIEAGNYTVVATVTALGYTGGATNTFTIIGPQLIATQPLSQMPTFGAPTVLSVTTVGDGPFTYQWQLNGADINGSTASNFQVSHGGQYDVIVTGASGSVTSSNATVTFLNLAMYAGLAVDGPPGSEYRIDYLDQLSTNWIPQTNITLSNRPYLYIDTNSPASPQRFYRAVLLP